MKKFYMSFFIVLIVFLSGCTQKTDNLKYFQKDPKSAMAIQYTKKRDIFVNNELKAMIFVTYLNKVSKKYASEKLNTFIIGIHLINKENKEFEEEGYTLLMNGEKPKNLVSLKKDSSLVEFIPLKNTWAKYYLVHFDNDLETKKVNITFSHPSFGIASLNFDK